MKRDIAFLEAKLLSERNRNRALKLFFVHYS